MEYMYIYCNTLRRKIILVLFSSVADLGFAKGGRGETMASARSASLNGGLGCSPQQGPGVEPLVGGQEAESFLYIFIQKSGQKLRI